MGQTARTMLVIEHWKHMRNECFTFLNIEEPERHNGIATPGRELHVRTGISKVTEDYVN